MGAQTGAVELALDSTVGGAATVVATTTLPGVSYSPNTVLRVRMEVTATSPTTLRAKAWVDGTTEPGWMIAGTDTAAVLQTAGAVGITAPRLTATSSNA